MKQIFVFIFNNSKSQWLIYVVVYANVIILILLAFSWI